MPMSLTRIAYNALFPIVFAAVAPHYGYKMLRRSRSGRGFGQRFGIFGARTRAAIEPQRGGIWIHAVSVGEVRLAALLIREWRRRDSGAKIVLSTTTPTGQSVAQAEVGSLVPIVFNPIDFLPCVRSAFELIRPRVLVLVEAEVWPNYFWEAQARGVPVLMANARLSRRTEARYHQLAWFARPLLRQMARVCVQNGRDADRFARLGVDRERLVDTGSMKFDVSRVSWNGTLDPREILAGAGWTTGRPIFLAASTHRGEETLVGRVLMRLRAEFPNLFLIVAPRHMERGGEVQRALRELGLESVRRSQARASAAANLNNDVMILDTTGELKDFYPLATVTFVGKSLLGRGGQNFLEPVQGGTPVVLGPHMENFDAIAAEFTDADAVVRITSEDGLADAVGKLLRDGALAAGLVARARALFERRVGAATRTVDALEGWTKNSVE
ncbi:MAG TPA: 3-deoxy-D-manno-octulosonic acid transferase [Verrucomicrobiae bacterium]|nr:3-deoxy-D-manno-octulosonic acid transferase [Verrucomicrobiae bacterium]